MSEFSEQMAADHLIGNLYFNLDALPVVISTVNPERFPEGQAKTVYREMARLYLSPERNFSVGAIESSLQGLGFDFSYLTKLQARILPEGPDTLAEYCEVINRWADKQETTARLHVALKDLQDGAEVESVLPDLLRTLSDGKMGSKPKGRSIGDVMIDVRRQIEGWRNGETVDGYKTGFIDLDKIMQLTPGELTLIAARPSMGKTSIAMQIAENVARAQPDKTVIIFSAEMSEESLGLRMAASLAGVNTHRVRNRTADHEEYENILSATRRFKDVKIHVDDSADISTQQMYYRAAMLNAQNPLSLLVFDFVELGSDEGARRSDGEEQRISSIAKSLKAIAKNLGIPVVALSQLNREVEKRADKLPMLADLRYSGMLEQVSDVIVFLMRPEYYMKRNMACYIDDIATHSEGVCYAMVSKNRNGPVGRANLAFIEKYTRFGNLAYPGQGG